MAERNGTAVRRESRTGATSGSAPCVGERSPGRASLAKRPRIPNRDSRGGECEYLDIPLSVALPLMFDSDATLAQDRRLVLAEV